MIKRVLKFLLPERQIAKHDDMEWHTLGFDAAAEGMDRTKVSLLTQVAEAYRLPPNAMNVQRGVQIVEIGDEWPGGISDGLELPCALCGLDTEFDYRVEDDAWEMVVPSHRRAQMICLGCFSGLAQKYGVRVGDVLIEVQFTGFRETIFLKPESAYRY